MPDSNVAGLVLLLLATMLHGVDYRRQTAEANVGTLRGLIRALTSSHFRNMVWALCIFILQCWVVVSLKKSPDKILHQTLISKKKKTDSRPEFSRGHPSESGSVPHAV